MIIDRRLAAPLASSALLLAAFVAVYHQVLGKLVYDWRVNENYSHGFIVVPIALFFVWERRERLSMARVEPRWSGLVVLGASLLVMLAGVRGAELFLARVSMLGVIAGAVLFLFGARHLRILATPIAILLLMIPIPAIVFNQIAFPLQLMAARFGQAVLETVGIPVLREGNTLALADTTLEVAEACSGIRSLISLLTVGIVFAHFTSLRRWSRVVLVLSTVPLAIVMNAVRLAGTGIAAEYFGAQAAEGFLHTFSGWLVFVASLGMLILVHRVLLALETRNPRRPRLATSVAGRA